MRRIFYLRKLHMKFTPISRATVEDILKTVSVEFAKTIIDGVAFGRFKMCFLKIKRIFGKMLFFVYVLT